MLKSNFVLVSMREDFFYNKSELRSAVDQKLIEWIFSLNLNSLLVPNIKTLSIYLKSKEIKINGIILSGGNNIEKKSSRYKVEKKLVNISKKNNIPVLGICHGLQFLNYIEGGSLKKIKNHVGIEHKIYSKKKFPKKVNSYHNFGIDKLGKNFKIVAYSDDHQIEAIEHKKYPWLGLMWHPERDKVFNNLTKKEIKKFFKHNS
jgi:N5-(cytidine 5'-diphosphoramidyl)-L-glutamine hydrolase